MLLKVNFGKELDTDSDLVDCLRKLIEKTLSNAETNLRNEQNKLIKTYAKIYIYSRYSTCWKSGSSGKYCTRAT